MALFSELVSRRGPEATTQCTRAAVVVPLHPDHLVPDVAGFSRRDGMAAGVHDYEVPTAIAGRYT